MSSFLESVMFLVASPSERQTIVQETLLAAYICCCCYLVLLGRLVIPYRLHTMVSMMVFVAIDPQSFMNVCRSKEILPGRAGLCLQVLSFSFGPLYVDVDLLNPDLNDNIADANIVL
ncbi:hypothetical protein [Candidatus Synchoanobacter obligatus]|uniref:Uncharacterized protein n=1 Tax=Candidatus Synchoanobacter obligatus TaxID=2919597 RepID=A0ABT1L3T5_9GAMM|nr:hypothetical protein [Candidatus Synchoanobacter obligatus]MCP8351848.1 hypothetical protein [Candidatus Synchoanobacter obligatus]